MTNAYDRIYLERARNTLGNMLDYAVYGLKMDLESYWEMFLASCVSDLFAQGAASIIAGRSGVELALLVTGKEKDYVKPVCFEGRTKEYWLGWALAYYQWKTGFSFSRITERVPIVEIRKMYSPYHEMDIRQFCDRLSEMYSEHKQETNLKQRRLLAGISQSQLARSSGIPIRTIQQYEQGQKSINKARAEYLIALSRVLYCEPALLLENDFAEEK